MRDYEHVGLTVIARTLKREFNQSPEKDKTAIAEEIFLVEDMLDLYDDIQEYRMRMYLACGSSQRRSWAELIVDDERELAVKYAEWVATKQSLHHGCPG